MEINEINKKYKHNISEERIKNFESNGIRNNGNIMDKTNNNGI